MRNGGSNGERAHARYRGGVVVNTVADQILAASDRLSERLAALPPVGDLVALDPTRYCRSAWAAYLQMAARLGCVLVVGMNPGPHGMAQTGVPFTDPWIVDELDLQAPRADVPPADIPAVGSWRHRSHRARGVLGSKREESAKRLWPLLREICAPYAAVGPSADKIAEATRRVCNEVLLVNALPICWLDPAGKNVSAEQVEKRAPAQVREGLRDLVNEWLQAVADILRPAAVIGVGRWAREFVTDLDVDHFVEIPFRDGIKHPSPSAGSEAAWRAEAEPILRRAVELSRAARLSARWAQMRSWHVPSLRTWRRSTPLG